jgi:hypothetical protein
MWSAQAMLKRSSIFRKCLGVRDACAKEAAANVMNRHSPVRSGRSEEPQQGRRRLQKRLASLHTAEVGGSVL